MSQPPIHPDPTTCPEVTDHPDNDPTYRSEVNWGSVKAVASSGVQIVYGGPHYGRDPVNAPPRGIGIWKRESPNYRSWDGLLELPLHLIVTRWVLQGVTFGLRLPIMGMPPREPSSMLMREARHRIEPFSHWFAYATVVPARLLAEFVNIDPKTATMQLRGSWREYNYSTASPQEDLERDDVREEHKSLDNLYYIQLLRNELPSFHFWSYTDPIGNTGEMRHGLIAKGASACYEVEGDNLVSNIHTNFNRVQNLPLRNSDPRESEQITNTDPNHSRQKSRARSRSPGGGKAQTTYRTRSDDDGPHSSHRARRRRRVIQDISYITKTGEGEEKQEVKINRRKKRKARDGEAYKPDLAARVSTATVNGSEEDDAEE
ncbi:hypothetical protein GJ744_008403 [Endocarpon pusillum]|uniref:Uncharacterized protein n=1 Tax=Endocarpon pusillum TaxID=364733 RepID=A0A8H7E5J7_9EURO|nr:hypothetical protein GJ744_008403 [Endocarpon pusillum]